MKVKLTAYTPDPIRQMYLAAVFNYLREEIGMIRDAVDEIEMEVLHGKQK